MKIKQVFTYAIAAFLVVCLTSCTTGQGAGWGAGAGALFGYVVGGRDGAVKGAALGAGVGALIGHGVAKHRNLKNRADAAREVGYSGHGYYLGTTAALLDPSNIRAGNNTEAQLEWVAIGPDPSADLPVKIAFQVTRSNKVVRAWETIENKTLTRGGGKIETIVAVTIPEKSPRGLYSVDFRLQAGGEMDTRSLSLQVL